jgi:hypothetical protein
MKLAIMLKCLPLGTPPNEVLKSFPVGSSHTIVSCFKILAESGHGCALFFPGRRDIGVFGYEHTLKAAVEELAKGKFPQYLKDKPEETKVVPVRIPKRFDVAIQSLIGGYKTAVVGDNKSVRDMIAFMSNLLPIDFRGYASITVWCNTTMESSDIIGLPKSLLEDASSYLDAGKELKAVIDVNNRKTLGKESTDFSKETARLVERDDIEQARQKLTRVFSNAFSLAHGEKKEIAAEEAEVTGLIARRLFGHGAPVENAPR